MMRFDPVTGQLTLKPEPSGSIMVSGKGGKGDPGEDGAAGPSNLFIQQSVPNTSEPVYQWWETDGAGNLVTLWVETNGA